MPAQSNSTSTWGLPSAPKRALLLHGLTSTSASWYRVAEELAREDFYVIAPDLIGHGYAARVSSYAVKDFVEALKPQIESHIGKIDVVVGHSLGGIVALGLYPYLLGESKKAVRVVLVDPVFKLDEDTKVLVKKHVVAETSAPWTVEQYQAAHPRWTQADCAIKLLGAVLCDSKTCELIIEHNMPWTFSLPEPSPQVDLFILGADPAAPDACVSLEEHREFAATRPDVHTGFVKGTTHSVHREEPEAVVQVILQGDISKFRVDIK